MKVLKVLHWFPTTVITNYPNLVYENRNVFSDNPGGPAPEESYRAHVKGSARLVLLEATGENPFLTACSFWWLLSFLGLWLHHSSLCFCCHISFSELTLLLPSYTTFRAHPGNPELCISQSLIQSHLQSPFAIKGHNNRFQGLGPGH